MDSPQPVNAGTGAQLTDSMSHDLKKFIKLKLTEYGWLCMDKDNNELRDEILIHLLNLCAGNSRTTNLRTLADNETQTDLAEKISTNFLSLDPTPNDRRLLAFTECVVKFFRELYWNQFAQFCTANNGSPGVGCDPLTSAQAALQIGSFSLTSLPGEIRNMIYTEALVVPNGGLKRSFTPPALLCANALLRDEALPIFYKENKFEITIKRSPADKLLAGDRRLPSVDMWVWRQFLHVWGVFNGSGTNGLRHVRNVTLIYELSMDNGYSFGDGEFDKGLGFRFSHVPFEEHLDPNYEDDSDQESDVDSYEHHDEDSDENFDELETEVAELEDENTEHEDATENDNATEDDDASEDEEDRDEDEEITQSPEEEAAPVGVLELNRGTYNWPNCRNTHLFLFRKISEFVPDRIWDVYPCRRLSHMLWRCVRECPQASKNVDFLCEDLEYWTEGIGGYTRYESVEFYDPDAEDD